MNIDERVQKRMRARLQKGRFHPSDEEWQRWEAEERGEEHRVVFFRVAAVCLACVAALQFFLFLGVTGPVRWGLLLFGVCLVVAARDVWPRQQAEVR